jgi:hypothetical protein
VTTLRRIFVEKRALIVPLLAAIALNIAVYALVVYPQGLKSAGAAQRAANAATSLKAAEQDYASARELVAGKSRAEQELTTFYGKVLPADQLAAVRLTYVPLPAIAKKANVKVVARRWQPEPAPARIGVARGRLRGVPPVHLRARDGARVRDHRRREHRAGRAEQAAGVQTRAVDVLPAGSEWQLADPSRFSSAR